MKYHVLMVVSLLLFALASHAAEPLVSFETADQRARYDHMLKNYRCLKCQNQNLADSHADLAGDLRREIRARILEGFDDQSIDNYLVARYGDFVRYSPRFGGKNLVLWLTPVALLAIGLIASVRIAKRGRSGAPNPSGSAEGVDSASMDAARKLLSTRDS